MSAPDWETVARYAMLAAAALLFIATVRRGVARARSQQERETWQAQIAAAHQARTASGRTRARHLRTR